MLAPMPKHLAEECEQILAKEFAGVAPDAEMTMKEYRRRYDAAIAANGSEEIRTWCKRRKEIVEENRRGSPPWPLHRG